MRVFFQIAYFVIGLVQFFAIWDGAKYFFDVDTGFGSFLSFIFSAFLTYIPLVGSILGVYGAANAWDWSLLKSIILFFWYVPVFIAFYSFVAITER